MQAGLYIHIPFCKKKCSYCDFYSVAATNRTDEFIAALKREMDLCRDWLSDGVGGPDCPDGDNLDGDNPDSPESQEVVPGSYDTLFLGGGTPSLLSIRQLAEIVTKVREIFPFTLPVEWTIEANPDDLTLPYLQELRSLGFNRLSLGIQSLRDENLTWLGRRHTAAQGLHAIEDARLAGFDNLNIDLIYGLPACVPGSSSNQWFQELQQVLALKPEHLSCYQLSYEPHTKIFLQLNRGLIKPLDETEEARYFLETSERLESAGYVHYEVSNFSRRDSRGDQWTCRHNQKYWQHIPYLGLGPCAHSFIRKQRHWNHRSLSLYCHDLQKGILPIAGEESLGPEELRLETIYLGFRTRRGVHLDDFQRQYGQDLLSDPPGLASRLINEKKLEIRGDWLCPTTLGLAIADSLAIIW